MMAFCNQCGAGLPEGARFCASCGAAAGSVGERPPEVGDRTAGPTSYSSTSQSPITRPGNESSDGLTRMVLPALVVIAVLVLGFLFFTTRKPADTTAAQETISTRSTGSATRARDDTPADEPASTSDRRAVDEASDAATLASERTTGAVSTTSAAVLDSAFFNDPRGAALRYPGPVRVSGVIASMVMPGRTPALSMEGRNRFNYMVVNFPEGYRERLAALSKGQYISVSCDAVRGLAGTTILSGCLLV